MPTNKKSQKHGKKRSQNSHSNFKLQVQVPALRVRLPYSFYTTITEGAAGLGASYSFAVNSAFDPDFSGGGLQPLGLDQYAQFYGRYRVVAMHAEVVMVNRTTTPQYVGAYLSPQSTLPAVAAAWPVVNTTSRSRFVQGNTGGNSAAKFIMRARLEDVFGVTKRQFLEEADFQAIVTNSPARIAYLHLFTIGRSAIAIADFSVKLYMDVEFSQSVALSLS